MSVRIRLRRMGAKKRPFYRIVVADSRQARDGRFIDQIGYYDPIANPPVVKIDEEKAKLWIGRGAQPSDVTRSLFRKAGIETGKGGIPVWQEPEPEPEPAPKKRTTKKEAAPEPAAEAAPEPKAEAAPEEPAAE